MIYVGIDIAKNTHWASAMNSDGEILLEPFSFQNNNEGFQKFISKLSSFDKQKMLIGLESTAHYGENIISYLFNLDYKIGIINPIQTSNLRKSNIRKTKNDKVDTFIIIKSLTLNNYNLVTTRDINNIKLKGLSRSRHNLIVMKSRSKIQLVSFIDQLFPELNKFSKGNLHLNVSYQLLKEYSSPKQISSLHLTKLTNILHDNSHGRYNKQDAIRLRELAKNSAVSAASSATGISAVPPVQITIFPTFSFSFSIFNILEISLYLTSGISFLTSSYCLLLALVPNTSPSSLYIVLYILLKNSSGFP